MNKLPPGRDVRSRSKGSALLIILLVIVVILCSLLIAWVLTKTTLRQNISTPSKVATNTPDKNSPSKTDCDCGTDSVPETVPDTSVGAYYYAQDHASDVVLKVNGHTFISGAGGDFYGNARKYTIIDEKKVQWNRIPGIDVNPNEKMWSFASYRSSILFVTYEVAEDVEKNRRGEEQFRIYFYDTYDSSGKKLYDKKVSAGSRYLIIDQIDHDKAVLNGFNCWWSECSIVNVYLLNTKTGDMRDLGNVNSFAWVNQYNKPYKYKYKPLIEVPCSESGSIQRGMSDDSGCWRDYEKVPYQYGAF